NAFANAFINYYYTVTASNSAESLQLLDSILLDKQEMMNAKNAQLQGYKSSSGVLDITAQSGVAFQQVNDYENRLANTIREIESSKRAIARINEQLNTMNEPDLNTSVKTRNNEI